MAAIERLSRERRKENSTVSWTRNCRARSGKRSAQDHSFSVKSGGVADRAQKNVTAQRTD